MVWKNCPEDYLISLSQLDYPNIFLKNPEISRAFKRQLLDIQKSDYYRLQYLYDNGGIYSDFDNIIDYPCLMKVLEPYRKKDLLVFMTDGRHTRQKTGQMTTNLIFAPYPKMPILKKMLDAIDQTKQKVWDFSGMRFVGQFKQPVQVNMGKCVRHTYDWSWYEASNQVLGKKSQAHPTYAKKLLKKQQIMLLKDNLQKQLKQVKTNNEKIQSNLKKLGYQNQQLKNDYKKLQTDFKQKKYPSKTNQIPTNENKKQAKQSSKIDQSQINEQIKNILYLSQGQKLNYEQKINKLEQINTNLQFQRDMYILEIFGGIIVFFFMLVVAFCIVKSNKNVNSSKKYIIVTIFKNKLFLRNKILNDSNQIAFFKFNRQYFIIIDYVFFNYFILIQYFFQFFNLCNLINQKID